MERKRFCEVTKMAGVDAAQQARMKKIYDATLLVARSDLYTVKYTVMYTVVYTPLYTPHTVAGVLWRYMQCAKGDKSIKRIPHIQRNSVKYAVFGGVREI